jgi:voltage-gated potassium channel
MNPSAKLLFKKLFNAIFMTVAFVLAVSVGYKFLFPDASFMKCLFATITTVTTVGFEDLLGVSGNDITIIYTIFVILIGLSLVLYCISVITAVMIEGHLYSILTERYAKRRAGKMKGHVIVCGAGTTSYHVIENIYQEGKQFIVIDNNQDNIQKLKQSFKDIVVLLGDGTSEDVLKSANIDEAATLVAILSNDRDNLFLTITAKMMNPNIQVISRAIDFSMQSKFKIAGANYVVSPNYIGGHRIAARIINPNIQGFLETIIKQDSDKSINLYHVTIPENSNLVGKKLMDSEISKKTGLNVISYSPDGKTEDYIFNPSAELEIKPGSMLLFIGSLEQKTKLEELVGNK